MGNRDQQLESYFKHLDEAGKASAADRDFFQAAKEARLSVLDEGLWPSGSSTAAEYSAEQAAKAACVAREDIAHAAIVNRLILKRLDRNRNYMWAIIVLLFYIASQLK